MSIKESNITFNISIKEKFFFLLEKHNKIVYIGMVYMVHMYDVYIYNNDI